MESAVQSPEIAEAPIAAKSAKVALIVVVLVGLLVGGGVGTFVAGPAIAAKFRGKPAIAESKAAHGKEGKDGPEGGAKVLRIIDNLVLNPAGSGGTRFLMLTATLQVKDAAAEELLKSRDAEVRDAVLDFLGRKTIDELTDMTKRDAVKKELLTVVQRLFPAGTIIAVYFPQFVIQ